MQIIDSNHEAVHKCEKIYIHEYFTKYCKQKYAYTKKPQNV